jgi:periplasmic copper chaperone A
MHRRLFLLSCLAAPRLASAHSLKWGPMRIGHAWALPSNGADSQAFMPLLNTGEDPEALIGARCKLCKAIVLRNNGRPGEAPADTLALEPNVPLAMRPGARHLHLIGLTRPLTPGFHFAITLDFLNLGGVDVETWVEAKPGD